MDNRKDEKKNIISSEIANSVISIKDFLSDITKHIINKDKDKCEVAIDNSFKSFAWHLSTFVATTIVNNNIEGNKDNIIHNIKNVVNSEYYSTYMSLSDYTINGINVASMMKNEWIEDIEKTMIDVIYNKDLDKEHKIVSFNNRIVYQFKSYTNYITNKVFNH